MTVGTPAPENRSWTEGGDYRYGCISIAVPYGAEHAAWTAKPLLVTRKAPDPGRVREMFQEVAAVHHGPEHPFRGFLLKAALLRLLDAATRSEAARSAGIRNSVVLRAVEVMSCRRSEPGLSIAEIARRVGVTANHLVRVFRSTLDTTPGRYLTDMRVRDAQMLLAHSSFSIKWVAAMLGFRDQLYFSRVFRRAIGASPTEFRARGEEGLGVR
jgi:transcriptional regulator GlxA family with amidase domain